jgi:hypothetical protein
MSLTAHCRVPHPVRPNSLLWLQGTLILETPEISSYQIAKVGHDGQGLPPVMLNFEYLKLGWFRTVQLSLEKIPFSGIQGECCLEKGENFSLIFVWYFAIYRRGIISIN